MEDIKRNMLRFVVFLIAIFVMVIMMFYCIFDLIGVDCK